MALARQGLDVAAGLSSRASRTRSRSTTLRGAVRRARAGRRGQRDRLRRLRRPARERVPTVLEEGGAPVSAGGAGGRRARGLGGLVAGAVGARSGDECRAAGSRRAGACRAPSSFKSAGDCDEATAVQHRHASRRSPTGWRSSPNWRRAGRGCGASRASERRVAIVLANYPNRDGRLANGVGLDTPAGHDRGPAARMAAAGYDVARFARRRRRADRPFDGRADQCRDGGAGDPRDAFAEGLSGVLRRACRRRCGRR